MIGRLGSPRDPFEGRGARRRDLRIRVESVLAFGMAIAACGLVAAMWLRILAPLADGLRLG
jgi:prepilin signal peptidase PulO-like enzyme (type II secretory pathway)